MEGLRIEPATEGQVQDLTSVINAAYAVGEDGLWVEGTERVTAEQVTDLVRAGELIAARVNDRIEGCARVHPLDPATAELGTISVDPDRWGNGLGGELLRAGERRARELGATAIELSVLSPRAGEHPQKVKLRAWYERFGYRFARIDPFDAPTLAKPCEFQVLRKELE